MEETQEHIDNMKRFTILPGCKPVRCDRIFALIPIPNSPSTKMITGCRLELWVLGSAEVTCAFSTFVMVPLAALISWLSAKAN